jgi:tripartite-type tricarboxylate transporter receptor subunit TctC
MRSILRLMLTALVAAGFAGMAAPGLAQIQQKYPSKPVRIVSGFSAGSATDITARMLAPKLSDGWGQPVVVENRSGAGGVIAASMVAQAAPDGYTLLLVSSAFAISAAMQPKLPYDPLRDLTGVAQIGFTTSALVVTPLLGVKSAKELIELAHERPGWLLYGSAGVGSGLHMSAERFRLAAGIQAVHVGFRGQPEMLVEIIAGRVHFGVPSLGTVLPFIKDGRLLALAVATPQRSPLLPDVPALAEVLPGFERDASHAILAPARTPRPISNQISREIARVLELNDVKQQMQAMSFVPAPTTPEEQDRILRVQIETFTKVVRLAGLRAQ